MAQHIVAPSILAADFGKLRQEVQMVNQSQAQWLHVDIMDGVFVPNISFGEPVLKSIQKNLTKYMDVHLMITDPDRYVDYFKNLGADNLTVHFEACTHLHRTIQAIAAQNMNTGIAINPHTPIHLLTDIISDVDLVCIMSVNPGFGGQSFIENTYRKVDALKNLILQKNAITKIEIDGGVSIANAKKLIDTGADILVAGSSVFKAEVPNKAIEQLYTL